MSSSDSVHVQRCTVARQADLFADAWYPDDAYNPYSDDQHLLLAGLTKSADAKTVSKKRRTNA